MFRALYDFAGTQPGCLSFKAGDQFTALDDTSGNWLRVQNGFGEIGLVPYNYVAQDKVAHTEVLKSIDRAIEAIHYAASANGDIYTAQQRDNLQKLIHHRRKVVDDQRSLRDGRSASLPASSSVPAQPKRIAPGFLSPTSETGPGASGICETVTKRSCNKREAPPPPVRVSSQLTASYEQDVSKRYSDPNPPTSGASDFPPPPPEVEVKNCPSPHEMLSQSPPQSAVIGTPQSCYKTPMSSYKTPDSSMTMSVSSDGTPRRDSLSVKSPVWGSPTKSLQDVTVPAFLASELIERVRRDTGLSYNKTQVAIETVVSLIAERVPSVQSVMEKVLLLLVKVQDDDDVDVVGSHDAQRLEVIFSELNTCKDDSQQRSWALHEDESIILEYLQEFLSILENAKPSICRKMISSDNYEPIHNLVQYYQMETRVTIRLAMLKVFVALCGLDHVAISCLLYSVLPLELSRELQTNLTDISRSSKVALVLTMLFSMGEDLPINHYVHLNLDFVRFLLDTIEAPPSEDESEQLPDLLTNLVLSFNLHLRVREENIVMAVLGERGTSTVFTEKLMILVNRDDDPVRMFPHEPKPANSLLKFLTDLYSDPATSDLFYTNDAAVLIDIIIRQLADLSAGDKVRTTNLTLSYLLLKNSPYREGKYRSGDLHRCLLNIFKEEEDTTDKIIVQQIFQELPEIFNSI